jgi:hypothetical protein
MRFGDGSSANVTKRNLQIEMQRIWRDKNENDGQNLKDGATKPRGSLGFEKLKDEKPNDLNYTAWRMTLLRMRHGQPVWPKYELKMRDAPKRVDGVLR